MKLLKISKDDKKISGCLSLTTSKSICNRVLIIRALSGKDFEINGIAAAEDSQTLIRLLNLKPSSTDEDTIYDAGAAGTAYRFLTAYLAIHSGTQILTGSQRMKERPIKILVDALNHLGAHIEYMEREGYPPLRIHSPADNFGAINSLEISAGVSSQYISALLMIAPLLPHGLILQLQGKIVSKPYIQMTLNTMGYFGIKYDWSGDVISVSKQQYQPRDFSVEADWSAASYYYAIAAFSEECDLKIDGLYEESVQGDSVLKEMMQHFGVVSTFDEKGIHLSKTDSKKGPFNFDFVSCPDLAQTLAFVCGGLGIPGFLKGLETLKIKETDRIAALNQELSKLGIRFSEQSSGECIVKGEFKQPDESVKFETHDDHRMAMIIATLAMIIECPINILDPDVVVKSYPEFWEDLKRLGFNVEYC